MSYTGLHPEDHYCLTSAAECLSISPDEYAWSLRNPPSSLSDGSGLQGRDPFKYSFTEQVKREYAKFRAIQPASYRLGFVSEAISEGSLEYAISDTSLHFKSIVCQEALRLSSGKKAIRRCSPPSFVRRVIRNNTESMLRVSTISCVVRNFVNDCIELGIPYSEGIRFSAPKMIRSCDIFPLPEISHSLNKENKKDRKKSVNAVSKASSVLDGVYPEYKAAFFNGEDIKVYGDKFNFTLSIGDLMSTGYSGLKTILEDKDGVVLSHLCVYFEDTPAPEQLVNMITMISNGMEDEILKKANFNRLSEKGKEVELIYKPKIQSIITSENSGEESDWRDGMSNSIDAFFGLTGYSNFRSLMGDMTLVKNIGREIIKNDIIDKCRGLEYKEALRIAGV